MYNLNSEDFDDYLSYLNELTLDYFRWQQTHARKEHVDEYGDRIKKGDFYYSRQLLKSPKPLRLSRNSMEKLLYLIFEGNEKFQVIGKKLVKKSKDEFEESMRNFER